MTCILAPSKLSRLELASVAEQAGLNLTGSKISEDTFSHVVAHMTVNKIEFYSVGFCIISVGDLALSRMASWRCAPVARSYVACGRAVATE